MLIKCLSSIVHLVHLKLTILGNRSYLSIISRTGKRTKMGALMDGVNSVIRYFNNNFSDGYFEDCLNLTFNQVEMGSRTDHIVKNEAQSTLVRNRMTELFIG